MQNFAELEDLIKNFEGLMVLIGDVLKSYQCPAGVWTIGYGSTGPDVKKETMWPVATAEKRMREDAANFVIAAKSLCPKIEGNQLSAIADFAYNLGSTRLAGSTLRRKINRGDMVGASMEFERWVRAGGRILMGLVLRRQAEKNLFLKLT